jgi:pectin methylesterase-like acyl-CoA thioesterase
MRGVILLLTMMAATLVLASGVALAVGIGSAAAQSSIVGPGESIQKAIDAADPGDTIIVRGVHRENVIIRKNGIKLLGQDAVIEAPPSPKRTLAARGCLDRRRASACWARWTSRPARCAGTWKT